MLLREHVEGTLNNIVVSGFGGGVDTRNDFGGATDTHVTIERSMMFDNLVHTVAYEEGDASCTAPQNPECDDDLGFDERAWFENGNNNLTFE